MPNLFEWYLQKIEGQEGKEDWIAAWGRVTQSEKFPDTYHIHTSKVLGWEILEDVVKIKTHNSEYFARIDECFYNEGDTAELMPELKEKIETLPIKEKEVIEKGTVLLTFSNAREYYFEDARVHLLDEGLAEDVETITTSIPMSPHIGTFHDSCIINGWLSGLVTGRELEFKYFPKIGRLDFYSWHAGNYEVFVENTGDADIYLQIPSIGTIKLLPGERKKVAKDVTEKKDDLPLFDDGELYPAQIL